MRHSSYGLESLLATVVVEPTTTEPPIISTGSRHWMHRINHMVAESEESGDSFLGDGLAPGHNMAVAIGKSYAPASTTINAIGRVEHTSEYTNVDESGAICFPLIHYCRRAGTVIKIAGEVMLEHGYTGQSNVVMHIACGQRSRIITNEEFRFYRELESIDSKACPGFSAQSKRLFTSKELRDRCRGIAQNRMNAFFMLYKNCGKYVRHDGTPV